MFHLRRDGDGVASITLDRPPANAFDEASVASLARVLNTVEQDEAVRAVLFHAAGRFFSAGADIRTMHEVLGAPDGPERLAALAQSMQDVFARIEMLPVPTVCALSGIATGGGFELALACDIRVTEADVLMGLPEALIGLLPGAGGTQRLTRIAGSSVARRLILTGELISGKRAAELGLLHDVTGPGGSLDAARSLCARLATVPRGAQAALKRCLALAPSAAGYTAEIEETLRLQRTPETQRLIRDFVERRAKRSSSRLPTGAAEAGTG
jgi:enoyl-CoA hydratase/carnithine racemase